MEYDQQDQEEQGSFWDRMKESPRTVSVLIVILIVAAAIYAFSDNQPAPEEEAMPTETEEEITEEPTEGGTGEEEQLMQEESQMPQAVSPETLNEQNQALPTGEQTDEGYVETAQAGDGITHVARRAAIRHLSDNEAGYSLTNEHRIYIEDYIKDSIGSRPLALGEQVSVSTSLVQEAVVAAGDLTPGQLQNLSQYTSAL